MFQPVDQPPVFPRLQVDQQPNMLSTATLRGLLYQAKSGDAAQRVEKLPIQTGLPSIVCNKYKGEVQPKVHNS